MSGIGNKRVAAETSPSAPPEKKAGVEDSETTVETIKLGGVSSTEELDIRTLQTKNRKLAEMLDQRQAIEDELREHIEKLEKRQATDDASLLIVNRYWSQFDENIRIILKRYDLDQGLGDLLSERKALVVPEPEPDSDSNQERKDERDRVFPVIRSFSRGLPLFIILRKKQVQALLGSFSQAEALLTSSGVQPASLDGVLLDAGCSSLQLDTPERGFSLKKDGPLNMRMDGDRYPDTPTAADVVNALDQQALASILKTYGEEKHAKKIASTIVQARSIYPITRTRQLASIIAGAFPETILYARKDKLSRPAHIATKTFQALRIFVNNELHELYEGLKAAEHFLKPGGRLVAITFHSLEDRIVKRFLHGIDISERFNLSVRQKIRRARMDLLEGEDESLGENYSSKWKLLEKKVLTPQDTEIKNNPRGRSAKLRGAIKL